MARSCSSANSLYFEDIQDHSLFFHLLEKYLGNMIELVHYGIIPTGWIILFKVSSEKDIRTAYHQLRSRSRKAKETAILNDIGSFFETSGRSQ